MGFFGFVAAGGGGSAYCSAACSPTARLALDLPGQRPDRRRRCSLLALRSCRGRGRPRAPRRRGRRHVTVALMLAVYAIVTATRPAGPRPGPSGSSALRPRARRVPPDRVRSQAAGPAGAVPPPQRRVSQVVGVLWAAAMFAWFFLSALYLQQVLGTAPSRSGSRSFPATCHGWMSLGSRQARHEVRRPPALVSGCSLAAAPVAALGRRAGDGRLPPTCSPRCCSVSAPGSPSTRCCSPRWARRTPRSRASRPGVVNTVHDGRRARPGRAGQCGCGPHRGPGRVPGSSSVA